MKKISVLIIAIIIFLIFSRDNEKGVNVPELDSPYRADIIKKTVVVGRIIPRQEVEIKPQVSGVIQKLMVKPGQKIQKGDVIAVIQLIPNLLQVNAIESQIEQAQINWRTAKSEWDMHKSLYENQLISTSAFDKLSHYLTLQEKNLHEKNETLQLLIDGQTHRGEKTSNTVLSTINGIVLDIPHKEGDYLVEASTFQSGTTVAVCADMEDMIFEGLVDESDVGKIREGMVMNLSIDALEPATNNIDSNKQGGNIFSMLEGRVDFIAPKGILDQGTIKFLIQGRISNPKGYHLKANFSANAHILLDQRNQVIAINERNLITENNKFYVDVYTAKDQLTQRRAITIGISDGVQLEVIKGLSMEEKLKPVLN